MTISTSWRSVRKYKSDDWIQTQSQVWTTLLVRYIRVDTLTISENKPIFQKFNNENNPLLFMKNNKNKSIARRFWHVWNRTTIEKWQKRGFHRFEQLCRHIISFLCGSRIIFLCTGSAEWKTTWLWTACKRVTCDTLLSLDILNKHKNNSNYRETSFNTQRNSEINFAGTILVRYAVTQFSKLFLAQCQNWLRTR